MASSHETYEAAKKVAFLQGKVGADCDPYEEAIAELLSTILTEEDIEAIRKE